MKVSEVMSSDVHVLNCQRSVLEAARMMRDFDIGSIPVEENDKMIGMITDRDIVIGPIASGKNPESILVKDCMHKGIQYCFDDEDVNEIADRMGQQQIRRLPVVNRNKRLVGIVSLGDLATHRGTSDVAGDALTEISSDQAA